MFEIDEKNPCKIAILGLENAGKTSIIHALTREFEMFSTIKPTSNLERTFLEFLGNDLVIWDFGGQKHYRERYLDTPEKYFNDIAFLFYVIDIQDMTMLGSNIMYFQAIYRYMKQFSPHATIIFLFHKRDPDLHVPSIADDIESKFLNSISDKMEEDEIPIIRYHTSIYNPRSIIMAISQPIFDNFDLAKNVSKLLKSFSSTYGLLFASLITNQYFEVAFYSSKRYEAQYPEENENVFNRIYRKIEPNMASTVFLKLEEIDLDIILYQLKTEQPEIESRTSMLLAIGFDEESTLGKEELIIALQNFNENIQKIFNNIDYQEILRQLQYPTVN